MYKFKFLAVFIVLVLPFFACANQEHKDIETEVLAAFQSLVQASKDIDEQAYFAHFDKEKFVGLNSDGSNWNSFDELSLLITNGFAAIKEITLLEFTNVKVSVIDNRTAILVNEYRQSMRLQDDSVIETAGGGTQVWSKQGGTWKLVSVSASDKPLRK